MISRRAFAQLLAAGLAGPYSAAPGQPRPIPNGGAAGITCMGKPM
jgi:hypothetical protein